MIDLREYGFMPEMAADCGQEIPARVTAVHRDRYQLISELGSCFGRLKAKAYYRQGKELFSTVGDFVLIEHNPLGDSMIVRTLRRKTFFSRRAPDPGRPSEQAIAANFDTVFPVQSLNENFNINRLERYLVQARQSGAEVAVILTKADLPGDHSSMLEAARQVAKDGPVIPVSARTGEGLAWLDSYLRPGKTFVLLGSSGVGKSSLINRLAGEEKMAVGAVREGDAKGRHTTTHRQLLKLPCGALVIDTPGMRELGMWNAEQGLRETFEDIQSLLGNCRFSNCRHETEPGCAVREAIRQGELSPKRWMEYQSLLRETASSRPKRRKSQ